MFEAIIHEGIQIVERGVVGGFDVGHARHCNRRVGEVQERFPQDTRIQKWKTFKRKVSSRTFILLEFQLWHGIIIRDKVAQILGWFVVVTAIIIIVLSYLFI